MWHRYISLCRFVYISHGLGMCFKCYYFSKYKHTFSPPYVITADSEPRCNFWGVLIFWCGVSLAQYPLSWGCWWMGCLTSYLSLDTLCLWAPHNLPGVHKFCSLFVHKIQWRSLLRFVCEGLFRWGGNGWRLAFSWDVEAVSFPLMLLSKLSRAGWRCLMGRPDHAAAALNSDKWHQFCNIPIFQRTHSQNLFKMNSLALGVVSCLFKCTALQPWASLNLSPSLRLFLLYWVSQCELKAV